MSQMYNILEETVKEMSMLCLAMVKEDMYRLIADPRNIGTPLEEFYHQIRDIVTMEFVNKREAFEGEV